MELKTLKDLGENHSLDYKRPILFKDTFVYKDLRTEAIKWVKQLRKDPEDLFDYGTSIDEFIKHFFNLKEEDLKDE